MGGNLVVTDWIEQALLLAAVSSRIATACLLIPLFSQEIIPPLVRNSVFIALGLVAMSLQPELPATAMGAGSWVRLLVKEAFVGVSIGFFFGTILWALESAGQIIDTKVGATQAQIVDPLSGHQTSLTGALFGRLANLVFLFSGGLGLLIGVLIESYAVWPISAEWPHLIPGGVLLYEREFGRLLVLATLFAAPILTVLFVIDAGLGLMNRFAQQLNVYSLSMGIKAWLSTALVILMLGTVVDAVIAEIASRHDLVIRILQGVT